MLLTYKVVPQKDKPFKIYNFASFINYALPITQLIHFYFFFLLVLCALCAFSFSIGVSIQSRFGWPALRSDLLTVINELFRWFSRFCRLFFPSRLTSCYSSGRLFLLHALISRQPFRSPTPPHHFSIRRSLPPSVISSPPPFPFFRLSSFYRRIPSGMASPQLCSTFSFSPPRRVLTRESMSLITFPHTRPRLIRARIYLACQLQYTRHTPLLRGWCSWPVCKFIRRYRAQLTVPNEGGAQWGRPKGNSRWWPVDMAGKLQGGRISRLDAG